MYGNDGGGAFDRRALPRLDGAVADMRSPANFIARRLSQVPELYSLAAASRIVELRGLHLCPERAGVVGPVTTSLELAQDQDWGLASAWLGFR